MRKLDLRRQLKHLYQPPAKEPVLVDVPAMGFLMVDGAGDPNTSCEFQQAAEALYGVSYTLKFMLKKGPQQVDYPVMPLEGLWRSGSAQQFDFGDKSAWHWTLMIMQPDVITEELIAEAAAQVKQKKDPPALSKLRFEEFHEGPSAQVLHIGPYSAEGPTVEKLYAFIRARGRELRGNHHEIYMSDPRRAKPERLKTVIRQPVA